MEGTWGTLGWHLEGTWRAFGGHCGIYGNLTTIRLHISCARAAQTSDVYSVVPSGALGGPLECTWRAPGGHLEVARINVKKHTPPGVGRPLQRKEVSQGPWRGPGALGVGVPWPGELNLRRFRGRAWDL